MAKGQAQQQPSQQQQQQQHAVMETYARLMDGAPVNARMKNFWCNAIASGTRTLADFERTVVQSDEYALAALERFKAVCRATLGALEDGAEVRLFEQFMADKEGKEVPAAAMEEHVRRSAEFDRKYGAIVASCAYLNLDGLELEDAEAAEYLERIRADPGYEDRSLLQDMLDRHRPPPPPPSPPPPPPAEQEQEQEQEQASSELPPPPLRSMSLVSTTKQEREEEDEGRTELVLEEFRRIAKRPMYVQEYLRYRAHRDRLGWWRKGGGGSSAIDEEDMRRQFAADSVAVITLANVIRDVRERYLGMDSSEYDAVRTHLHLLPAPTASGHAPSAEAMAALIREEAIATPEYEAAMRKRLSDTHEGIYTAGSVALSADDLRRLFARAKRAGLSLVDDGLRACVSEYQEENDQIQDNIFGVFTAVYDRQPDRQELERHVAVYRGDGGPDGGDRVEPERMAQQNARLECELASDLEFHDVLKKKVKQRYMEAHGTGIFASALYATLRRLVRELQEETPFAERRMARVEALVADAIASQQQQSA